MGASASSQNFVERVKEPGSGAAVLIADDDPAIRLSCGIGSKPPAIASKRPPTAPPRWPRSRATASTSPCSISSCRATAGWTCFPPRTAEGIRTVIIVITAASTMNNAVEAMKRGAHDYLTKPFDNLDLVAAAIERAVEVSAQAAELNRLKDEVESPAGRRRDHRPQPRDAGDLQADRAGREQRRHRAD